MSSGAFSSIPPTVISILYPAFSLYVSVSFAYKLIFPFLKIVFPFISISSPKAILISLGTIKSKLKLPFTTLDLPLNILLSCVSKSIISPKLLFPKVFLSKDLSKTVVESVPLKSDKRLPILSKTTPSKLTLESAFKVSSGWVISLPFIFVI